MVLPPVWLPFVYVAWFVCVMAYASVSPAATVNVLLVSKHVAAVLVLPLVTAIEQDIPVLMPLCCTVTEIVLFPE